MTDKTALSQALRELVVRFEPTILSAPSRAEVLMYAIEPDCDEARIFVRELGCECYEAICGGDAAALADKTMELFAQERIVAATGQHGYSTDFFGEVRPYGREQILKLYREIHDADRCFDTLTEAEQQELRELTAAILSAFSLPLTTALAPFAVAGEPLSKELADYAPYRGTEWYSGDIADGLGLRALPDGGFYNGEWKNGLYDGCGLLLVNRPDTYSVYIGDFCQGIKCGEGHIFFGNGCGYVGGWRDNLYDGDGTLQESGLWCGSGRFVQGERQGAFDVTAVELRRDYAETIIHRTEYYKNDKQVK